MKLVVRRVLHGVKKTLDCYPVIGSDSDVWFRQLLVPLLKEEAW